MRLHTRPPCFAGRVARAFLEVADHGLVLCTRPGLAWLVSDGDTVLTQVAIDHPMPVPAGAVPHDIDTMHSPACFQIPPDFDKM